MAAPRSGLDALAKAVWQSYGAGALSDVEAGELCELIAARRAPASPTPTAAPRRQGSAPRTSASLDRRRRWTASGWLPPAIAARFTMGEQSVLSLIVREIAERGACELHVGAIAARAGVSATTVRNARRQAERIGVLSVEVRRVAYDRNLPNRITLGTEGLGREVALWSRTRARAERQGGGCKIALPTPNHSLLSLERTATTARAVGQPGGWSGGKGLPRPAARSDSKCGKRSRD